eukprot:7006185-Pyramimonas_sp.AAC.1
MQTVAVAMYEDIGGRALNGVNDLYASVLFFRSQGNFLRLICSVRKALDSALVIRVGPPPPEARSYTVAFRLFLEADRRFTPSASTSAAALSASKALLDKFFDIFNGRYWLRGIVEVFLDGRSLDRGEVIHEGSIALLSAFFHHLPCVPSQ